MKPTGSMRSLVAGTGITIMLIALAGLGPAELWVCDLLANIRLHSLAALLGILALQLWFRLSALATSTAVTFLAVFGATFATASSGSTTGEAASVDLHVVSYNLGSKARRQDAVYRFLAGSDADILILQEYSHDWHSTLKLLQRNFPYAVTEPRVGSFGIAVYSRRMLSDTNIQFFPRSQLPFIQATVLTKQGPVTLLGLHLQWPMLPTAFAERNSQLEHLRSLLATRAAPLLACGDWNLTPWSRQWGRMRSAGFSDGTGPRMSPTWPSRLGMLGIAIDHCLVSPELAIVSRSTGPALGSDHRPIIVRAGQPARRGTSGR